MKSYFHQKKIFTIYFSTNIVYLAYVASHFWDQCDTFFKLFLHHFVEEEDLYNTHEI